MKSVLLITFVVAAIFVSTEAQSYYGLTPLGCPTSPSAFVPEQDFNDFMYQEGDLHPLYVEWWTFSFHDTQNQLGGIVNYFYISSAIPFTSYSSVNPVIILPNNRVLNENDKYGLDDFNYQTNPSSVSINEMSGWSTGTDGDIFVYGTTQNGSASWYLEFSPNGDYWCWANNTNTMIGLTELEDFNWLFAAPSASVFGNITVNGNTYELDGVGENDHVWGDFIPGVTLAHWMSAQGWSDDGQFMFYFAEMNKAYGFIRVENFNSREAWDFFNDEFETTVQYDGNGRPISTTITGKNGNGDTFTCNYQPVVQNLVWPSSGVFDMISFTGQLNSDSMTGRGRSELIGGEEFVDTK